LREIQPLGRTAEAAGFDHRVKATQLVTFNLHHRRITDRALGYRTAEVIHRAVGYRTAEAIHPAAFILPRAYPPH
jgi:hypothetical protein